MRAEFLQKLAKDSPDALAKNFAVVLKDFGYAVDQEHVRSYIEHFLDGTPSTGGPEFLVTIP